MIVVTKKYCVYEHIRKDTDTPFYIGKGVKDRPFEKHNRGEWWKNIVNKAGYSVRIIKQFDDESDALNFESELQILYNLIGYKLCNLAVCGGHGSKGVKHTKEALEKIRTSSKLLWENNEYASKMRKLTKGNTNGFSDKKKYTLCHPVHGIFTGTQYDFKSKFGIPSGRIPRIISGEQMTSNGWRLSKHKNVILRADNRIFIWEHSIHGIRICKKKELLDEFKELKQSSLCRLISGEYSQSKGWIILRVT